MIRRKNFRARLDSSRESLDIDIRVSPNDSTTVKCSINIDPVQVIAGARTFYQAEKYPGCAWVIPVRTPVYTATHVFFYATSISQERARSAEINWEGRGGRSYGREGDVSKREREREKRRGIAFSYSYTTTRTRKFPTSVYAPRPRDRAKVALSRNYDSYFALCATNGPEYEIMRLAVGERYTQVPLTCKALLMCIS